VPNWRRLYTSWIRRAVDRQQVSALYEFENCDSEFRRFPSKVRELFSIDQFEISAHPLPFPLSFGR
jgi:hypothetical protein